MNQQLSILDTPNYRRSDPATSKQAGEAITRSGRRKRDQDVLLNLVRMFPGSTSMELAQRLIDGGAHWWKSYSLASKRVSDLHAKGLVVAVGERKCSVTGGKARIWRVI